MKTHVFLVLAFTLVLLQLTSVSAVSCVINGEDISCDNLSWWMIVIPVILGVLIFGLGIFLVIFWILMLIDCIQRDFKKEDEKIIWILVIIFVQWVGAIIYYFFVKRKHPQKKKQKKHA